MPAAKPLHRLTILLASGAVVPSVAQRRKVLCLVPPVELAALVALLELVTLTAALTTPCQRQAAEPAPL